MDSSSSVPASPSAYTGFSDLVVDGDVAIKVLVCRSWDVKNPTGKYIGTEYILSDDAGKAVHCIARSAIAHCVVSKLQVGKVFALRRFTVSANKATYRVRRDDHYLINLESNTLIHKLDCSTDGFIRQPFLLTPFEDIVSNNSAFLIDVIGRPVNVGACKAVRTGSKLLDFDLANERGASVKVTLWGALCDELTKIFSQQASSTVVLLPAMNIRDYRGELRLSSTSGTIIYSEDDIPEIATFRNVLGVAPIQILHNYGTLLGILTAGREQVGVNTAQTVTCLCKVKITGIRPRTPWNYYSCGEKGCRKGVTPSGSQFWCASCEKICEYPVVRYHLRLEVSDDTTSLVVTLFDDVAESLVKKSAVTLLESMQGCDEEVEYPDEIQSLIGTVHDIEIKSHTYYNHGHYESFTVTRVLSYGNAENVAVCDLTAKGGDPVITVAEGVASPLVNNASAVEFSTTNDPVAIKTTDKLRYSIVGSMPPSPAIVLPEPQDGNAATIPNIVPDNEPNIRGGVEPVRLRRDLKRKVVSDAEPNA